MRFKLIFSFFIFISLNLKADLVLGMHAQGNQLAFAFKKTVRVVSVITDSVVFEKELCKDTQLVNLIFQKAKSMAIRDGSPNPWLLSNIKDFTTVNLTYFKGELWIGIRYFNAKPKESKYNYGLIRLNENYQFKNFYLFKLKQAFTFPPYFPLEFKDQETILLPDTDSGKIVFRAFNIYEKQNEILPGTIFKKDVQVQKMMQVKYPESIVLDPNLYSVQGDQYQNYFMFPKPVLLNQSNKIVLDAHGISSQLKNYQVPHFGDGTFLMFNRHISTETIVLLSSLKHNDSLKFLVSIPDKERVWLHVYNQKEKNYITYYIKASPYDNYFLVQERRIIALSVNDKIHKLKIISY